jgi:hypothetical protein
MRFFAVTAVSIATVLATPSLAHAEEPDTESSEKNAEVEMAGKVSTAAAKEPETPVYPPPGARWGVIGVGIATSALFYGAAAGMSYAFPDAPGAKDLRTPFIGPWQAIAHNGCAANDTDCSQVWVVFRTVATAIGGLAQAGGILVALEGVFMPTQYASDTPVRAVPKKRKPPVEPESPPDTPKNDDQKLFWIPTPMALGTGGVGVGVVGRF